MGAPVKKGERTAANPEAEKPRLWDSGGEIPSVRAYLKEAKQNRRGYC